MGNKKAYSPGKAKSGLRMVSKRARAFLVISFGALLIGFVGLPLWINGYLFAAEPPAEVYAAEKQLTPAPTATPAPTSTPEPTPTLLVLEAPMATPDVSAYHTLSPQDEDEAVASLQGRLMELGYFDYDETTEFYGPVTQSAVQLVQRVLGEAQTGVADPAFQALIFSDKAPAYRMTLGDKGSDVRGMQARLNEFGYYEEKVNGYFGVATQRAVLKFQTRNDLSETGEIDGDARSLLYSPDARPAVDATPKPTAKPTPKPTPKPTQKPTATAGQRFEIPEIDSGSSTVPTPAPASTPAPTRTPSRWEEYLETVEDENEPEEEAPKPTNHANPNSNTNTGGSASYGSGVSGLIAAARAQLGRPYVWSEESPENGFDCSGLVYYSLRQAGVGISRWNALSYSQYGSWQAVTSLSACKKGDLLFYKSDKNPNVNHTGIYLGNGQFIHASSSQGRVVISSTTGYYERNFVIARRVF